MIKAQQWIAHNLALAEDSYAELVKDESEHTNRLQKMSGQSQSSVPEAQFQYRVARREEEIKHFCSTVQQSAAEIEKLEQLINTRPAQVSRALHHVVDAQEHCRFLENCTDRFYRLRKQTRSHALALTHNLMWSRGEQYDTRIHKQTGSTQSNNASEGHVHVVSLEGRKEDSSGVKGRKQDSSEVKGCKEDSSGVKVSSLGQLNISNGCR